MSHMGAMVSILTGLERTVHLEDPDHPGNPLASTYPLLSSRRAALRSFMALDLASSERPFSLALLPPLP